MTDAAVLLADLQRLLPRIEDDIRERTAGDAELTTALTRQHTELTEKALCGEPFTTWLDEEIMQAAVSWILSCVFVRFIEDNELFDRTSLHPEGGPWLAGRPANQDGSGANRLQVAHDAHEAYFTQNPRHNDRQYLEHVFGVVGALPACKDLFARDRCPLWKLPISADMAKELLTFWQERDLQTNTLKREFTAAEGADGLDTRFLGDLYQDLSADARDRFALLQTPVFVEEFILDYTLDPAIETFGLKDLRLIDPTCGSGHFLLGAFHRLLGKWERSEKPGVPRLELVKRSLASVFGVDINPYAVAVARFRLLVAALVASGRKHLLDLPAFELNLAVGDSLLVGARHGVQGELQDESGYISTPDFLTPAEYAGAKRILDRSYHAVVGNPPYIAVKDAKLRERIKGRYASCFKKWTLSVPFTERFFNLAARGEGNGKLAGYVGLINSNNFTRREFGSKLIEGFIPQVELTHVIDTTVAYIPGHPNTLIMFGRNRQPTSPMVRAVLGVRGDTNRAGVPAENKAWRAIVDNVDAAGVETPWVSIVDADRATFFKHPWSLAGGGASELKGLIETQSKVAGDCFSAIGFFGFSAADEILVQELVDYRRQHYEAAVVKPLVAGDDVRDWVVWAQEASFFPYADEKTLTVPSAMPAAMRALWSFRTSMWNRPTFSGATYKTDGLEWWRWHQVTLGRLHPPLTIAFGEVTTHNHFVLCRGGVVFNQTAPVIKLPAGASEDDHFALLSCLNSSLVCFWLKQVCSPKGGDRSADGARVMGEQWEDRYAFNASNVRDVPIPDALRTEVTALARQLDGLGRNLVESGPAALCLRQVPTLEALAAAQTETTRVRETMIALQEEMDWLCYHAYGVLRSSECSFWVGGLDRLPRVQLGQRAFEIALAGRMAAGEQETAWFERHRSTPISGIPAGFPSEYRTLLEHRLKLIGEHPYIGLLEKPEHKRRWSTDPWEDQVEAALHYWLCDRMEKLFTKESTVANGDTPIAAKVAEPCLVSTAQLADRLRQDADFVQVAELYRKSDTFDLQALVTELVQQEGVPYLPALRYTESGLRKRDEWERVWELQREEDRIEAQRNSLESRIESRRQQLKREHLARQDAELEALRLGLDKRRREFHAHWFPDQDYDELNPLDRKEIPIFGEKCEAERIEVQNLRLKHEQKSDELRNALAKLAAADAEHERLTKELDDLPQLPKIPVPPRYDSKDFKQTRWWQHRGKLDVPKERWVLYHGAEGQADSSLVFTWAGYDHLQQAKALATYYLHAREQDGWPVPRLIPLLAGLDQLVPWLKQWHNDVDPSSGERLGDFYATFVEGQARSLGQTMDQVRSWRPAADGPPRRRHGRRRAEGRG